MKKSIRANFILALVLLCLVIVAVVAMTTFYLRQLQQSSASLEVHHVVNEDLIELTSLASEAFYFPTPRVHRQINLLVERLETALASNSDLLLNENERALTLKRLAAFQNYHKHLDQAVATNARNSIRLLRTQKMIMARVSEALSGIRSLIVTRTKILEQSKLRHESHLRLGGLLSILALTLSIGLLAYVTITRALNPIGKLQTVISKFAKGKYQVRAPEFPAQELNLLAESFNQMAGKLEKTIYKLEETNDELESFAYSVSHDLRAPLRAMDGFSQALLEDYAEKLDERGQDYLDRVRNSARKMGELIDDILKLSRVGRADLVLHDKLDLTEMVDRIWREELPAVEHKERVEMAITQQMTVKGDPALLRVALTNLLGNALKFTAVTSKPRIEFTRISKDGEMVFCVKDNGAGFDPRFQEQLFHPFKRLHGDAEFEGSGIGLAIVQRVIDKHRGRIWADGDIGQGAAFYFTLFEQGGRHE